MPPLRTDDWHFPNSTLSKSNSTPEVPFESSENTATISPLPKKLEGNKSESKFHPQNKDVDYIPRPPNAFILFRSHFSEEQRSKDSQMKMEDGYPEFEDKLLKRQRQSDISKSIGNTWRKLSKDERLLWEKRAEEKKLEYQELYPKSTYLPQRPALREGPRHVSEESTSMSVNQEDVCSQHSDSGNKISNNNMKARILIHHQSCKH